MPAEWERHGAVLLAWPHRDTDWAPILDEVTRCYVDIVGAVTVDSRVVIVAPDIEVPRRALSHIDPEKMIFVKLPTNDTWTRDYGPITVEVDGRATLLDFQFNGWGLKFAACHDNRVTRRLIESRLLTAPSENRLDFVLEGGSIESDGVDTIMTTSHCLMAPNRNATRTQREIERYLKDALGANHVLWLDNGALAGDDTDSHVDTLARLAPNDTIIYTGCDDPSDEHYDTLAIMADQLRGFRTLDGRPYNLIGLPLPDAIYDPDGERLPATYANYLVSDTFVIVPSYGQPRKDELARQMLRISFPDHDVRQVDCRALIRQHGSLHCATMQLYPSTLSI